MTSLDMASLVNKCTWFQDSRHVGWVLAPTALCCCLQSLPGVFVDCVQVVLMFPNPVSPRTGVGVFLCCPQEEIDRQLSLLAEHKLIGGVACGLVLCSVVRKQHLG